MVGGNGVRLGVTLAVGEGGNEVEVGVRVKVAVAVGRSGITVARKVGNALQAVVPAMHKTRHDHKMNLVLICIMGKDNHLQVQ